MADSVITPLGSTLPDGWNLRPLGEMCSKIGSGATPKGGAAVYVTNGISFIRSQNVFDHKFSTTGLAYISAAEANRLSGARVQERDVLLNITGDGDTIARCCIVPAGVLPARVNQHVMIIRVNSALIPEFLQRYLSHPAIREYMLSHNSGGSRRALTKGQAQKFLIAVPPLHVQRSITAVLGVLDDKIAINDRIAETADGLGLSLASEEIWTDRTRLDSLCTLRKNQVNPSAMADTQVAHYSLPAFDSGKLAERVKPETIKSSKFLVSAPAVLLSKLNPNIPRVWNVHPEGDIPAVASTEFLVLEPREGVSTHELWAVAAQSGFLQELASKVTGTSKSHQRVQPAEVMAADVVDPRAFGPVRQKLDGLALRATRARTESLALTALRDTLLSQLMSGRLRVRDAEQIVEDAL